MLFDTNKPEEVAFPKSSGDWQRALTITADDAAVVLEHTKSVLRDGIDRSRFNYILDFVIMRSLGAIRGRLNSVEFQELRDAFTTYEEISVACRDKEDSPPPFPNEWLANTKAWIECMNSRFSRTKLGSPTAAFAEAFYPWSLAAFAVCFDREPKPSRNGPTNRFVLKTALVIRQKIDALESCAEKKTISPITKLEIVRMRDHWPTTLNANQVRMALRRAMGLEGGFEQGLLPYQKHVLELQMIFAPGVRKCEE